MFLMELVARKGSDIMDIWFIWFIKSKTFIESS
jgi:hypothetical protein